MNLAAHPEFLAVLSDRTHGASVLTNRLLEFLKRAELETSQAQEALQECRLQVRQAHPAIVALDNALALVLERAGKGAAVGEAAESVGRSWRKAVEGVVAQAAELVRRHPQVMTISHSGLVRDSLVAAKNADVAVWVGEGRPGSEGLALARELAQAGIRCTVYADMAFAEFLPEVKLALVGADAVGDEAFINKTGTRVLLTMARKAGVKTAVAYDPLKCVVDGGLPMAPEHPPEELLEPCDERIKAVNRWFETVPLALADSIVTARME